MAVNLFVAADLEFEWNGSVVCAGGGTAQPHPGLPVTVRS